LWFASINLAGSALDKGILELDGKTQLFPIDQQANDNIMHQR
jgi:hypothetical protein